MALTTGTRLGRYEIRSPLGAGGMGEVYLARDASLQRDVAVKVLPPEFAADPSRLRRFQQEALATAALNHPHIVGIFDVGSHDGIAYVVTELLDGRTLRDTLAAGALPLRKTVQYAAQIASGLAAAHDKGIVHRDLKPENVFVTADERVKILDFGIARVLEGSPAGGGETATMATETIAGSVIGTVGYMAPEQVRGERVDHRADIFAFGAVLYEMLTRRRAFKRDGVAQTLSAILSDDLPAWTGETSPLFNRAMRIAHRCVEKSPSVRFQSARDLSLVLADESTDTSPAPIGGPARGVSGGWPVLAGAAVVAIILGAFGYWLGARSRGLATGPTTPAAVVTTFTLALPPGTTATKHQALSPDGRFVAAVLRKDQVLQLFVLDLQSGAWSELRETLGAAQPFFSPDGGQIAFQQGPRLMRIALAGGPPNQICPDRDIRGGAWIDRGHLLVGTRRGGLLRIAVDDCATEEVTTPEKDTDHRFPLVVPGTSIALFTIQLPDGGTDVGWARMGTPTAKLLIKDARRPQFANGHVIFTTSRGDVFAAPLVDTSTMTIGARVPLPQRPTGGVNTGDAALQVAADGTLLYLPRRDPARQLAIVDRSGKTRILEAPPDGYASIRFDPVHQRLVTSITNDLGDYDLGVCGLNCTSITRVTANQDSRFPLWTPDGNSIVFSLRESNSEGPYILEIDGAARPVGREKQLGVAADGLPMVFAGRRLLLIRGQKGNLTEFWSMDLETPSDLKKEYGRGRTDYGARLTSAGMMAFVSVENGANRVAYARYPIREVPNVIGPGAGVVWSAKGDELFFQRGDQIWSQRFVNQAPAGEPAVTAVRGTRVGLTPGGGVPSYDVLPDGRFVIILASTDDEAAPLPVVIRNWASSFVKRK